MTIRILLIVLFLLSTAVSSSAEIYKYRDAKGVLRFTNNLQEVPKDQREKVDSFHEIETKVEPEVIVQSRRINDYMPTHMKQLITEALRENNIKLNEARIALLGYAFLENSDDTRNTPAKPLYDTLVDECLEVIVHDPYVKQEEGINLTTDLSEALTGKDCIALVTKHREYSTIDLVNLKESMRTPIIVDGRNVFNPKEAVKVGFTFRGVGIGIK